MLNYNKYRPPGIAERILRNLIGSSVRDGAVEDFEDVYVYKAEKSGILSARLWYWIQTLALVPDFIRNTVYWSCIMFKNYLKIAFRNIKRHKGYSFINISGLAAGMACCILILFWVNDELGFDRFHKNAPNLYRVETDRTSSGKVFHENFSPSPLAEALSQEFPEVIHATNATWAGGMPYKYKDKTFSERNIRAVDRSFFEMFTFPLLKGDPATILADPNSIVISENMKEKYFKGEDPVGKTITADKKHNFIITGVMKNIPANSSLQFDMAVPFSFAKTLNRYNPNWNYSSSITYVLLAEGASPELTADKITAFVSRHAENSSAKFSLNNFKRIHLHSYSGARNTMKRIQYVYIFSVIAVFVLVTACINFMNLSTARSACRAKEIGMRKISGALKRNIVTQFFGESILLTMIALIFSLLIVVLLLPVYNSISGKQFSADILLNGSSLFILLSICLFTGLTAGSYPALFLSSFQPVRIIQGSFSAGTNNRSILRKILVVAQFSISIFLLLGTAVVYKQLDYMKNSDLGYSKDHLIQITMRMDTSQSYKTLKSEFIKNPGVVSISASGDNVASMRGRYGGAEWDNKEAGKDMLIGFNAVGYDFLETMKIEIASGRSFSPLFSTDEEGAFVINEELVRLMGFNNESAVGENFSFMGIKGRIIGIMKDFHHTSFRSNIEPLAFFIAPNPNWLRNLVIRLHPNNVTATLSSLEKSWKNIFPAYDFSYRFLDEDFNMLYRSEGRMGNLFKYFTVLAVFIACLGLFGLASFMAEQRTKEVGIRKILGASVFNVVKLLSGEFILLVSIANIIAWPAAYFCMREWLKNFAYHTDPGPGLFILTGTLALIIALITVSIQAVKAARANPVDTLKYE